MNGGWVSNLFDRHAFIENERMNEFVNRGESDACGDEACPEHLKAARARAFFTNKIGAAAVAANSGFCAFGDVFFRRTIHLFQCSELPETCATVSELTEVCALSL